MSATCTLSEELIEHQIRNRRLVIDYAENETKKLRDEIGNLHHPIVGGMTVRMWHFGENSISNKPLASRTVVTFVGGDHVQHKFDTPWQRRLINDLAGTRYSLRPKFKYPTQFLLRKILAFYQNIMSLLPED